MQSDRPTFFFDFVDPGSFLASQMIDRAGATEEFHWVGWEICPPPEALIDPDGVGWAAYQAETARQGDVLGLPLTVPGFIPWSRKAHELAELGREKGRFHELRRALFRAHFIDQTDIGRIDLLIEVAAQVELDRTEAKVALDVDRYAGAVEKQRVEAAARQVTTVPALVFDTLGIFGLEVIANLRRRTLGKRI